MTPITCKCGAVLNSVAAAKVHMLVASVLPQSHVKRV